MENAEQARAMYAKGASIGAVAKALGLTWYRAKKLKPGALEKHLAEKKRAEAEEPAGPDEAHLVSVDLTEEQMDRIWSMLPAEEKALGLMTALTALRE